MLQFCSMYQVHIVDRLCYLPSTVPAGSLAKAASVGAKTVKGPLPERVSASPQAVTAAMLQEISISVSNR